MRARFGLLALTLAALACAGERGSSGALDDVGVPAADVAAPEDVAGDDVAAPDDVGPDDAASPEDVPSVDDAASPEDVADAADTSEPQGPDYVACDASDEAWVRQVVEQLLGRRVKGLREVRALEAMVQASSREAVARGLMRSPEFLERWSRFMLDELRVNRVGAKVNMECFDLPLAPTDAGQVAAFVRDHSALSGDQYALSFNMADVIRSALILDDVSPIYRAHLFAMMSRPLTGANVDALQMDMARRQDFGEIFEATYLHRNVVCNGCHNSQWSTTDNPDPAQDRHWPLPGLFEKAIYGASAGRPEREFYSNFRHLDLVVEEGGRRPWRMAAACGRFQAPEELPEDPAGVDAFFIEPTGKTASIWTVEAALQKGFDRLRADGLLVVDPDTLEVDPYAGFAYLVSVRFTNQVWREVMGYPLSLVHYFPRNKEQRDLLLELTQRFVASGFSLRELLVDIVTGPFFNEPAPADGCGSMDHPYVMPALFNPWILIEEDPVRKGNSVGDVVHRLDARQLIAFAETSLGWPASPSYPGDADEVFQKAVGAFVKDAEPGFDGIDFQGLLTWEARFGTCSRSAAGVTGSCVDACGGQSPGGCHCDLQCIVNGDCCADFLPVCLQAEVPEEDTGDEWFVKLEDAVALAEAAGETVTVGDVAAAVRDRLLARPGLDADEAPLIAAVMGAASLETPVDDVPGWLDGAHLLCGATLASPDYLLGGLPPEDQVLPPRLVVGETAREVCEALAPVVFDARFWKVACGEDGSVTVAPYAPPLGGVEPE